MPAKHHLTVLAVCAVAALSIAGCGSGNNSKGEDTAPPQSSQSTSPKDDITALPAEDIIERASEALKNAPSLKLQGVGSSDGEEVQANLSLNKQGDCTGKMTMGTTGSFEVIKLGKKFWMKPDDKFWETQAGNAEAAKLLKGKYLLGDTSSPENSDMADMCSLEDTAFNKPAWQSDGSSASSASSDTVDSITKGATSTISGVPVIAVKAVHGSETITAYIATDGTDYPVKFVTKGGDDPGTITLSDFGKPINVASPDPALVVDMDQL